MMQFKSIQARLTTIFIGISFLTMLFLGSCGIYGAMQENNRLIREYRRDMEDSAKLQLEWQTHLALSVVENCYQAQLRGELTQLCSVPLTSFAICAMITGREILPLIPTKASMWFCGEVPLRESCGLMPKIRRGVIISVR